jgi:hypothetical protein
MLAVNLELVNQKIVLSPVEMMYIMADQHSLHMGERVLFSGLQPGSNVPEK